MFDLTDPIYHDVTAARAYLEALYWPDGAVCPHCGDCGSVTRLAAVTARPGLHKCNSCRKQFTVTIGTMFEYSKIPLNKWMLGFGVIAKSKKGVSASQLHRLLGITNKSAWFMSQRIREAIKLNGGPLIGRDDRDS